MNYIAFASNLVCCTLMLFDYFEGTLSHIPDHNRWINLYYYAVTSSLSLIYLNVHSYICIV